MGHLANLVSREHAFIILGISSIVSLISGLIITKTSQKRNLEANSFFLKQSFYVDYVVHMLIMSKFHNHDLTANQQFLKETKLLEAEMLIKADVELLEDIIKIKKEVIQNNNPDKLTQLQINTLNKFRKKLHNKPITPQLFGEFVQTSNYTNSELHNVKKSKI